jgi:hypothetical protein
LSIPEPFVQRSGTVDERARHENESEKRAKARKVTEQKRVLEAVN